jgi:Tol biopolymer transport system component
MAAIWMLRGGSTSVKANYLNALQPISALPDGVCDASWSPEGDRLIFAAPGEGSPNLRIFMRRVHSVDQPQQITMGDHSESRPVWSPDGREIAFVRQADLSHFDIIRLNLSTHRETDVGRFVSYWPMAMDHPALDWSRDGRYFLTAEQTAPETPMRLIVVSAVDGSRRILTSPRSNSSGDVEGKFSPDGQHVAFRRGGQGDLFLVSMRGELSEAVRQLTHDTKGVRGIAWENDGQSILLGSQRGRTAALGIWRVSIDGGEPIPITEPGFDAANPAVSNKGALIIEHREIVSELAEQTMDSQGKPVIILPSNALDSAPAYSPDGRSIAFISTRSGWPELWLHQDNGALLQITHLAGTGTIFMPAWAPDGHAIVFSVRNNGATNIYVDDLRLNSVRKLTATRNRDISPVYSSDSKSIFFSSNDDGTSRIWRVHEDGTERPEPLFVEATLGFQTSMDGNWLYYWQSGQTFTLARRNLIDGSTEAIFTIPGRPAFLDCRYISRNKVYVASSKGNLSEADVYEVNPETKEARLVAQLYEIASPAMYVMPGMSIHPDGKRLIYSRKKYDKTMLLSANR